jgi:PAS domain S-box-containing protein
MKGLTVPFLLIGLLVLSLGLFVLWTIARRYRRVLGLGKEDQDKAQDISFIISAFQDVTRQLKEKEKELHRLKSLAEQRAETVESQTENILQSVSNGVITFDVSGTVTTMNRAAEEILGTTREQALGRSCSELFGHSDLCRLVQEALETRLTSQRMETAILRKQGRVWLGFNTALLTDRSGNGLGAILSFSDITEVKRMQEQMELKERLSALGEMSAGIAHELRNPMAVITGYLTLLAKRQDETGQDVIRDVLAEINGMNRIIGDLLTFARPTALNRVVVDIREMIAACVESVLHGKAEAARIETVLDLQAVTVSADEVLLRQALGNIIQNAVDAMPEGGTLAVRSRKERSLMIAVSDTGQGIPDDTVKKIFLPFFTTKEKGVGMGLALAHKIITSHGGRIDVESREGSGTTFTVTIPET